MCVCVRLGSEHLRLRPCCVLRPSAHTLLCLGFITGAGGLPWRLGISCNCAACVPVATTVGAAPLCLCLMPWWHRVWCDVRVFCWLDAVAAAWLGDCRMWLV